MKKLVFLIALTASLSLHASNPAANLPPPVFGRVLFVVGMARPSGPLTQDILQALKEEEQRKNRAQRQEQNAKQDAEPSNNKHKKWTTPKRR